MPTDSRLIARIAPTDDGQFLATYLMKSDATNDGREAIAVASSRSPTFERFASRPDAKRWVEDRAAERGLPVEWES